MVELKLEYLVHFGYVVLATYIFWCLYIAVMGCYRAHLDGRLEGITKILAYPLVLVGIIVDVVFQYTVACIVFRDLPRRNEYLVTARLQRYVAKNSGWRSVWAMWICTNLLDMFDPAGDHC
jgi:hypothetical protein